MKNSKNKKLRLEKLTVAKLENANLIKGGTIIIRRTYNCDSDNPRDCAASNGECTIKIRCVIGIGR